MRFFKKSLFALTTTFFLMSGLGWAEQWNVTATGDHIYNTNTGNVGIGTNTPTSKLHVVGGEIRFSCSYGYFLGARRLLTLLHPSDSIAEFYFNAMEGGGGELGITDGTAPKITFKGVGNSYFNAGNLGLGTDNPMQKLDVQTDEDIKARFYDPNGLNQNSLITFGAGDNGSNGHYVRLGQTAANNFGIIMWDASLTDFDEKVTVVPTGNVGIGTSDPQSKLAVNGTITAAEIKVTESGWADHVFNEDYALRSLESIEAYIRQHKHLPDIPSAQDVQENGIAISEMLSKQMQKIEELTLHLIALKKENESLQALKDDYEALQNENAKLESRIAAIERSVNLRN